MKHFATISGGVVMTMLATGLTSSATASPLAAWRETYQSSPASYEIELTASAPLTPEMIAQMQTVVTAPGTLRQRLAVTAGGKELRVRFSNEEGVTPLVIAAASVGIAGDGFAIQAGSGHRLSFSGKKGTVIAPGQAVLCDPLRLGIDPATELIVSTHLPDGVSINPLGGAQLALAPGNRTGAEALSNEDIIPGRPLVSGVLVKTDRSTQVIVALGDSITDANRYLMQARNKAWPEYLHDRLRAQGRGANLAVANAGIAGNRVLQSGMGRAALSRFDRDVAQIEGASYLIVLEGINDIGFSGSSPMFGESPPVKAGDLIAAYEEIIARSHARGIKVFLGTLLPFKGSTAFSDDREATRTQVNAWIRRGEGFDGVIDFDEVMRSASDPLRLDARYDIGDGLHPNDAGEKAMADSIDLAMFGQNGP